MTKALVAALAAFLLASCATAPVAITPATDMPGVQIGYYPGLERERSSTDSYRLSEHNEDILVATGLTVLGVGAAWLLYDNVFRDDENKCVVGKSHIDTIVDGELVARETKVLHDPC